MLPGDQRKDLTEGEEEQFLPRLRWHGTYFLIIKYTLSGPAKEMAMALALAAAEVRQVMITLCLPLTNAVSQSQSRRRDAGHWQ